MKALLVEEDGSRRSQLHARLHQRGWSVTVADCGATAISAFQAGPFPLVVLSHRFRDGDAAEVCRAIRVTDVGRASYLLVVIPAAAAGEMERLVEVGVDDFLLTPYEPDHLAARLAFAECRMGARPGEERRSARSASYPERVAHLEHALRVQQAALEELFQSAPEGIAVVDERDHVVRVNAEFSRMFGFSPEEVLGRPINQLIVPEQLRTEAARISATWAEGERVATETVRQRRDGSPIEVSLLATPIRVGETSFGAYGIYRDVTDRRAHERALAASEARYRALFDQSPVGVFLCDADLRITGYNSRLAELAGFCHDRVHRVEVGALFPGLGGVRLSEHAVYEGEYQPPEGREPRWVIVRYAPLHDPEGRLIGGMGVVEDVTERERADRALRAQAAELERVNQQLRERTLELERAMQARNRLYSSMNHELRTPISAIMLYLELLLTGALGEPPAEQKQALRNSYQAAQHLLELIRDVLDLSKIEAGKVELHRGTVELPDFLQELLATVRPVAEQYGSEIRLSLEDAPFTLETDAQRLRQILLNLLSNAAKFGRGQPIELRCRGWEAGVCIEVVDSGVGIAAGDLPHIFDDFVQVGVVNEGGTGLGLAISRRLAEMLDGRLEVESELDVGSTFRLYLPPTPPRAVPQEVS